MIHCVLHDAGDTVAVVSLPGTNPDLVSTLSSLVRTAGGRLVGSYRIGTKLGEPANKGLVDQLGTQMQAAAPDVAVPNDVSTYQRFGLLLGRAIGTRNVSIPQVSASCERVA